MKPIDTKVTDKYQTTVPRDVRKFLDVKSGNKVEWNIVRGMVIVDTPRKIKDPVKFLTSQVSLDFDAVKLVKESRDDFR